VAVEIIEDHGIAFFECRPQDPLDTEREQFAIDRIVDNPWCGRQHGFLKLSPSARTKTQAARRSVLNAARGQFRRQATRRERSRPAALAQPLSAMPTKPAACSHRPGPVPVSRSLLRRLHFETREALTPSASPIDRLGDRTLSGADLNDPAVHAGVADPGRRLMFRLFFDELSQAVARGLAPLVAGDGIDENEMVGQFAGLESDPAELQQVGF
jgi:hypothetical protein